MSDYNSFLVGCLTLAAVFIVISFGCGFIASELKFMPLWFWGVSIFSGVMVFVFGIIFPIAGAN